MIRFALIGGLVVALSFGIWRGVVWLRADAVSDDRNEIINDQLEADRANIESRDRIEQEVTDEGSKSVDNIIDRLCGSGGLSGPACGPGGD